MRIQFGILVIFFSVSCTSIQKSSVSQDKPAEIKKAQFSLPLSLVFNGNPPHDSIQRKITTYFKERNIQIISRENVFDLVEIQARNIFQSSSIAPGGSPELMLSQYEKKSNYVANVIFIEFTFLNHESNLFGLKWHNDPMPMKLTTYKKPDRMQVDSNLLKNLSWPESLNAAVESIILSGKLQ